MGRVRSFLAMTIVAVAAGTLPAAPATGAEIDLAPPPAGEHVLDLAGLLDDDDKAAVEAVATTLQADRGVPLVVVTIESMAAHWPHGAIRIETFAHLLFDQWQIGSPRMNSGILLLVSRDDRKARIQLGAEWGREQDRRCQQIMDRRIIPEFKRGRYGEGIVAGVEALGEMAGAATARRGAEGDGGSPAPLEPGEAGEPGAGTAPGVPHGISPLPRGQGFSLAPLCCGAVVVLAVAGVFLSLLGGGGGGGGHGGLGWGLGGLLGGLFMGRMLSGRGGRGRDSWWGGGGFSGGGFSGGGFSGGGFSGGGGATGSW